MASSPSRVTRRPVTTLCRRHRARTPASPPRCALLACALPIPSRPDLSLRHPDHRPKPTLSRSATPKASTFRYPFDDPAYPIAAGNVLTPATALLQPRRLLRSRSRRPAGDPIIRLTYVLDITAPLVPEPTIPVSLLRIQDLTFRCLSLFAALTGLRAAATSQQRPRRRVRNRSIALSMCRSEPQSRRRRVQPTPDPPCTRRSASVKPFGEDPKNPAIFLYLFRVTMPARPLSRFPLLSADPMPVGGVLADRRTRYRLANAVSRRHHGTAPCTAHARSPRPLPSPGSWRPWPKPSPDTRTHAAHVLRGITTAARLHTVVVTRIGNAPTHPPARCSVATGTARHGLDPARLPAQTRRPYSHPGNAAKASPFPSPRTTRH